MSRGPVIPDMTPETREAFKAGYAKGYNSGLKTGRNRQEDLLSEISNLQAAVEILYRTVAENAQKDFSENPARKENSVCNI